MEEEEPRFGESKDYHFNKMRECKEKHEIGFFEALYHPITGVRESTEMLHHAVGFLIAKIDNLFE